MKQEHYPAYTMLTNSALSNALALECMITSYIDDQRTEYLESAFSIASDQMEIVRSIRDLSATEISLDTIKLSARSLGVYLMLSSLAEITDSDDENELMRELPEAILTMIKGLTLTIKTIRCNVCDK